MLTGEPGAALRISVKGGGCSGFHMRSTSTGPRRRRFRRSPATASTVLVDPVSLEMMKGAELDFVDDLMGQSFKVKNPNAVASCGCGVSFSV